MLISRLKAVAFFVFVCAGCEATSDSIIPWEEGTSEESDLVYGVLGQASRSEADCVGSYFDDYRDRYRGYCNERNLGEGIGGDCDHLANYSLHKGVFEAAFSRCGLDWPLS